MTQLHPVEIVRMAHPNKVEFLIIAVRLFDIVSPLQKLWIVLCWETLVGKWT